MDALVGENLNCNTTDALHGRTPGPKCKVLLFSSMDGEFAPLIASRLKRMDVAVDALCPSHHVLAYSAAVAKVFRFGFATPLSNLSAAIAASAAGLIIPCDDTARYTLSRLYRANADSSDSKSVEARALIERSLGQREHFQLAEEKSQLLAALADSGVRLPRSLPIEGKNALEQICRTLKFPVVLKRDRTYGGTGVAICRDLEEVIGAYQRLTSPPTLRDTMRQVIRKANFSALRDLFGAPQSAVVAQAYIEGRPANRAVGCWQGKILAGLTVVAIETSENNPTRPSTVVQIVRNEEIDRMAEIVVGKLGLSGTCGLDFVIETGTELPYFLELNPRATPTCHLGRAIDSDVCAALSHAIMGTPPDDVIPEKDTDGPIALFPGELKRDPCSPYLYSSYHAVPWDDPKVLVQMLKQPQEGLWQKFSLFLRLPL
jgi:glutathione synthase/RimK-type ligase-like ATP-grasp enzyme